MCARPPAHNRLRLRTLTQGASRVYIRSDISAPQAHQPPRKLDQLLRRLLHFIATYFPQSDRRRKRTQQPSSLSFAARLSAHVVSAPWPTTSIQRTATILTGPAYSRASRHSHLCAPSARGADGEWAEVERLSQKTANQSHSSFLYSVYRQQYLELVESGEYHKAFSHLTKRLKPLESCAPSLEEFKDLCYLLTCKSVQEVVHGWEGARTGREQLVSQYQLIMELEEEEPLADADEASGSQHR
eukprot:4815186-Pleurochrysis_carterae.AAC.1